MYVYIYTYTFTYIYIYTHIHVHIHIHIHVHIHIHIRIYLYTDYIGSPGSDFGVQSRIPRVGRVVKRIRWRSWSSYDVFGMCTIIIIRNHVVVSINLGSFSWVSLYQEPYYLGSLLGPALFGSPHIVSCLLVAFHDFKLLSFHRKPVYY